MLTWDGPFDCGGSSLPGGGQPASLQPRYKKILCVFAITCNFIDPVLLILKWGDDNRNLIVKKNCHVKN